MIDTVLNTGQLLWTATCAALAAALVLLFRRCVCAKPRGPLVIALGLVTVPITLTAILVVGTGFDLDIVSLFWAILEEASVEMLVSLSMCGVAGVCAAILTARILARRLANKNMRNEFG